MNTYEFTRWSSRKEVVRAGSVEFAPGGSLVFRDGDRVVLGVAERDWNDVRQIDDQESESQR